MYSFTPDLVTGNTQIDTQHKELIGAINNLISACMKLKAADEVKKTLDFLVSYTARHFSDEEKLQIQYKYQNYTNHKLLHDNFKKQVMLLSADVKKNPDDNAIVSKLTKTVGDWLINHIKVQDVALAKYIASAK